MYTFRPLKERDINALKEFLIASDIPSNQILASLYHCMIFVIDKNIQGVITGRYVNETDFCITCVYIAPKFRALQFGEGIVKAYLNALDLRGVKKVVYQGELLDFFINLKFVARDNYVMTKLPDFFDNACHSKVTVDDIK